jgi:hypothetical protein
MTNDQLVELIRDANPVTREPSRPADVAWNEIVTAHERTRSTVTSPRRRATALTTRPRRLLAVVAVILLIAGVSAFVSVQGPDSSPSLTRAIVRAFGVVNANASTSGGFSTVPSTPQGFNRLTCPTSEVCYLESTNVVDDGDGRTVTKIYKTIDGGTNWMLLAIPSVGSANTAFTCSSASVCSVGFFGVPLTSHTGQFARGTLQSMLTTTDGGATWKRHVVRISPVLGDDPALNASLINVQGQWSQLQCFSAESCVAVAEVPSDQPQEPFDGASALGVLRNVIMRTDDGGTRWTSTVLPWSRARDGSPGWSNAQFMTLSCPSESKCLGLSTVLHSVVNNTQTSSVKVWRSSDGGLKWQSSWAPAPAAASSLSSGFVCPSTLRCYAAVVTGNAIGGTPEVMRTNDGGVKWSFEDPSVSGVARSGLELQSLSCASVSTCWTAGEVRLVGTTTWHAAMWATSDFGKRWASVPLPRGLGIIFQVVCGAPSSCLAVAQPTLKSGQAINTGPLPGEILSNQT